MMRLAMLAVMTTAWVAVKGAPAAAAPPSFPLVYRPTTSEALSHFTRGNSYYEVGTDSARPRVDRDHALLLAIEEYTAGQATEPAPAFDYNAAMAYRALGRKADAVDHFERFLARMRPEDDWLRQSVEKKLAALDPSGAIRAEREKQRVPAPATPPAPPVAPPVMTVAPTPTASAAPPGLTPSAGPAAAPTTQPPHWRARAGWIVAVAGLVAGGVWTYELVQRAQTLDSQSQDVLQYPADVTRRQLADRATQDRRTALGVGVAGGAVVATGLTLALWPYPDQTRTAWRLGITPNGLAVLGRF